MNTPRQDELDPTPFPDLQEPQQLRNSEYLNDQDVPEDPESQQEVQWDLKGSLDQLDQLDQADNPQDDLDPGDPDDPENPENPENPDDPEAARDQQDSPTLQKASSKDQSGSGILYLVATPIGNLEDMTLRALRILKEVDLIAAEDTRHSGQLLKHFQIPTPLISYHTHNRSQRHPDLIATLRRGESIALISDAGMPGISDPGEDLVQAAVVAGIPVVPIPGPTAVITALVGSGLATDRFVFEGFLPLKAGPRQDRLKVLQQEQRTIVLYEAPHRLKRTLQDLLRVLDGDRQIVIARELTKRFEEFWRGRLATAVSHYQSQLIRGELTLILAGAAPEIPLMSEEMILAELKTLFAAGISRSQASRQVAQRIGRSRREIYQLALTLERPSISPNDPD